MTFPQDWLLICNKMRYLQQGMVEQDDALLNVGIWDYCLW